MKLYGLVDSLLLGRILSGLFLGFAVSSLSAVDTSSQTEKPNILLILTDDQGYHDVGYYGTEDLQTPHIDQLSGEGVRFDHFYSNSSVCSPTRASILTGRFSALAGVPGVIRHNPADSWGYLDPDAVLLPERLKSAGYATALIGKWHLGLEAPNLPNLRGFDHFHGLLEGMMDDYWTHQRGGRETLYLNRQPIEANGHATDLFSDWAADYIEEQAQSDQPFFLFLAYNAPHFPVQPPPEWKEKVLHRDPLMDPRRAELVAFIEHLDHGIGRVMQALEATGAMEDTLIIFTSDNGGRAEDRADNGPVRGAKRDMYEGGLRVPFLAAWEGVIEPGSVSRELAVTMDLYPTLCDVVGIEGGHEMNGVSLLPLFKNPQATLPARPLFFMRREAGLDSGGLTNHAVRFGDFKLVKNSPMGPYELFNIADDPAETRDLSLRRLNRFHELNQLMQEHIRMSGAIPWQDPDVLWGDD